ncbi:MAG: lysophospholipid acyltransferase family protein [bacterium]|nr:lysophospholipid acyltransferase family protein [bacterium]
MIFKLLFHIKAYCRWRIPKRGGIIIASNHQSYIDPPAVGSCVFHRPFFFMARDNIFDIPVLGRFIVWLGAFPIKRGKFDLAGMNLMISLLKKGKAVVMFPEGTRSWNGDLLPLQPGIGIIAHKAQVPILPVYIEGFYKAWPRHNLFPRFLRPVRVIYGDPIDLYDLYSKKPSGEIYREITRRVEEKIFQLREEIKHYH